MPRSGDAFFDRFDLSPHEVGKLHQENFVWVKRIELFECRVGRKHVKRIKAEPEVGHVGLANDVPGLRKFVDHSPPRQGFVGDLDVHRNRQHRQLAQVAHQRGVVTCGMHRRRRTDQQQVAAERMAHLQHRFGDVDLVIVKVPREPLEISQYLKTRDT